MLFMYKKYRETNVISNDCFVEILSVLIYPEASTYGRSFKFEFCFLRTMLAIVASCQFPYSHTLVLIIALPIAIKFGSKGVPRDIQPRTAISEPLVGKFDVKSLDK